MSMIENTELVPPTTLNWNDLSKWGLVWKINKEILHPLGLAMTRNGGISSDIMIADDGVFNYTEEADARNHEAFNDFIKERMKVDSVYEMIRHD